jgi:hypothetical protein
MPYLPGNLGHLPRLGLGLWGHPEWVVTMESALVAAGALLYWRAARRVATGTDKGLKRAQLTAWLIGIGGIAVLVMDVMGA